MHRLASACCVLTHMATAPLAPAEPVDGWACWPHSSREHWRAIESRLIQMPTAESLRRTHDLLASEPHIAGTPGDRKVVDAIAREFCQMGLDVQVQPFWAYLGRPVGATLRIIEPNPAELPLKEEPVAGDPYSADSPLSFGWNAYSGSGEAVGGIVYANYGTKEDFERLAELGVRVEDKLVLARYGGNYRGFKARYAQDAGAAGVMIFTDPADSGYVRGLMYPEGGYATGTYIQRGSINTLPYPGDPLTPFIEATRDAPRLDPRDIALPRIPVQPIGWSAAVEIMRRMTGEPAPREWQGGLPLTYRVEGGDALRVELRVEHDYEPTETWNVIATLPGDTWPDQRVIVGSHHDAWGCGAGDPTSGTICTLEAARTFAALAREGVRPARTMQFCAWGAEEHGIIGSVEWVEANRDALASEAVAYVNLDMSSMGTEFGSAAGPALRPLIAQAASVVPQAREPGRTVLEAWVARSADALLPGQPGFGDLGGGSDHIGFNCHLSVSACGLGAGGARGTSYHSIYDNLAWYRKVVGDDYEPALMVSRMTNVVLGRLAFAPLLPLDPGRYGLETRRALEALSARAEQLAFLPPTSRGSDVSPELARVEGAAIRLERRAQQVRGRLIDAVGSGSLDSDAIDRINRLLVEADRAWHAEEGLPGRPWFRNLFAASDETSGYAAWLLPDLRKAIEDRDREAFDRAEARYAAILDRLADLHRQIERLLDENTGDPD